MSAAPYRIGVDIGGTFTDFVLLDDRDGSLRNGKLLTTPHAPEEAVLAGIRQMLVQGGGGAVVLTGSITALVGSAFHNPAYTASKGGLHAFARALAAQYAPQNIRVNVVAPGALETPPDSEEIDLAAREKRLIPKIPMGRVGRFEEIAPVVAFLASEEASYCTVAVVVVDGGFTIV